MTVVHEKTSHTAESETLLPIQLLLLKLLLGFGTLAIILIWLMEYATRLLSHLDAVAYPILVAIFAACFVIIQCWPRMFEQAGHVAFYTFALYQLISFQVITFGIQQADLVYTIATMAQWFPLVYTIAFIFFHTGGALRISLLVYGLVASPIAYLYVTTPSTFTQLSAYPILLNMLMAHPVYIVTLLGISWLKTHLVEARTNANAMTRVANIDYLTGVMNRRASAHELQNAITIASQTHTLLAVLLIDLDHFKQINDQFGHNVGDDVLIRVAQAIQEQLRSEDIIGRWGGEEFIVIVPDTSHTEAVAIAERLRRGVEALELVASVSVTISTGVAALLPRETPEALVARADTALYRAKQLGRNHVEYAVI